MPDFLSPEQLDAISGPVRVYRNLRYKNDTVFSVKQSRLIGYVPEITLIHVRFEIRESERKRAVFRHERNVHAWATGTIILEPPCNLGSWRRARYNCFKFDTFIDRDTEAPIFEAAAVHLSADGFFYLPEGSEL